jgi:hypothetical protein
VIHLNQVVYFAPPGYAGAPLLGRAMWPRNWGLCVAGDVNNKELRINAFDRMEDVTTEWCSGVVAA